MGGGEYQTLEKSLPCLSIAEYPYNDTNISLAVEPYLEPVNLRVDCLPTAGEATAEFPRQGSVGRFTCVFCNKSQNSNIIFTNNKLTYFNPTVASRRRGLVSNTHVLLSLIT